MPFIRTAAVAALMVAPGGAALAGPSHCSDTAELQETACLFEARDDFYKAKAICLNLVDSAERTACNEDASEALAEARLSCDEQEDAREDLCALIGEARYEPDFDPANFQDPRRPSRTNAYFPLGVGSHWTFVEDGETVDITVLDQVKLIEGVQCLVVNDVVSEDGEVVEDTDDWFALRKNGDAVYCGESVRDFETFPGDDPEEPELVAIDGSFKAGRDGDKSGTLLPGTPVVGRSFRQEWSASNAEDAATILSTTYRYGRNAQLDQLVPPALANLLCSAGDCLVIAEFSPLDPDAFEHKYFARGVGKFLEVSPADGKAVQLVACNVDPRCRSLPQP